MKKVILPILLLTLFVGCKEDDPVPTGAETQAILLAGEKNKSKVWIMTSATEMEEGNPATDIFDKVVNACFLDNKYTFSNNANQEYTGGEGAMKCRNGDPDEIESGHWAFTLDGKFLIVSVDTVRNSDGTLFSLLSFPATVTKLTSTEMILNYTVTGSETVNYRFTFKVATN